MVVVWVVLRPVGRTILYSARMVVPAPLVTGGHDSLNIAPAIEMNIRSGTSTRYNFSQTSQTTLDLRGVMAMNAQLTYITYSTLAKRLSLFTQTPIRQRRVLHLGGKYSD